MAAKTNGMRLAITNPEEIFNLIQFLNDLVSLKDDPNFDTPSEIDFSEYQVLGRSFFFSRDDHEELLRSIIYYADNIHYHRILWNADTMLRNCADLTKDTLDFSPDIKRGLELLELEKKGLLTIKDDNLQTPKP